MALGFWWYPQFHTGTIMAVDPKHFLAFFPEAGQGSMPEFMGLKLRWKRFARGYVMKPRVNRVRFPVKLQSRVVCKNCIATHYSFWPLRDRADPQDLIWGRFPQAPLPTNHAALVLFVPWLRWWLSSDLRVSGLPVPFTVRKRSSSSTVKRACCDRNSFSFIDPPFLTLCQYSRNKITTISIIC